MELFLKYFEKLMDYIYKKRCYFCNSNKESVKMCSKCYNELISSNLQPNRTISGVKIYSAGCYEKNLQKMIRGIKYHRQKDLAYYQAKFMWEYFSKIMDMENITDKFQIVPVPIYKTREKKRGYNQMQLVGEQLSQISGFPLNNSLIKRIKDTKPQYKLSRTERMNNLNKAFKIDSSKLLNMPILLIDDICTTGSTFEAIIEELNSAGINNITCLATASPD